MEREDGVVVRGRVEIDMRKPFRSVKEAVMLFGEKVLAGEIHAKHLQQVPFPSLIINSPSRLCDALIPSLFRLTQLSSSFYELIKLWTYGIN